MQLKGKMKKSNLLNEITRMRVMMGLAENVQQAYKLYFQTGKLNKAVRDAILNITGGDNYTKLVADLYYHMSKFNDQNPNGVDPSLIRMVEDFYDDLLSYDNKLFPFTNNLNEFGVDKPNDLHILTLSEVIKEWHKFTYQWSRLPSLFKRNLTNDIKATINDGTPTHLMRWKYKDLAIKLEKINKILPIIPKRKLEEITPMLINSNKSLDDLLATLNNMENSMSFISSDMVNKDKLLAQAQDVNADVIMDTDKVLVFKINDHEAMQEMGCYSNWCFSQVGSEVHWEAYAAYGYVYLIYNLTVDTEDARFLMVLLPETDELYLSNNNQYEDVYQGDTDGNYLRTLGIDINKLQ